MTIGSVAIPLVMCAIIIYGLSCGVDIFDCFLEGAREGVSTSVNILPALVALMTCVGMFKASGALDIFTALTAPISSLLQLPREVMPLAILRPISGSGAMVIFKDILSTHGPDSYIGRIASVIQGSTETTFYTIAVYYGATKITKTRHTLPASLTADVTGMLMSAIMVRMLMGR